MTKSRVSPLAGIVILLIAALLKFSAEARAVGEKPLLRLVPEAAFRIDPLLERPYSSQVPFGSTGRRLWATSPQGWAFPQGVHFIYMNAVHSFNIRVAVDGVQVEPDAATYYPSHVHLAGSTSGSGTPVASASFTYAIDDVQAPLQAPFDPARRWTCWSSGHREDWYRVDFPGIRGVDSAALYFYDDQPTGGCAPPEAVTIEAMGDTGWKPVEALHSTPAVPQAGKNVFQFAPIRANSLRFRFRNRGEDRYTGLYGVAIQPAAAYPRRTVPVRVEADKFITPDDVMVTALSFVNRTSVPRTVLVEIEAPWIDGGKTGVFSATDRLAGIPDTIHFELRSSSGSAMASSAPGTARCSVVVPARGRKRFTVALAVDTDPHRAGVAALAVAHSPNPTGAQVRVYQGWYDRNIAAFDCPDRWVRKMVYHRWYNLLKNSMDPRIGHLQHKAFAEGRWTSDWYANIISYGAGHVAREARWLADPSYSEGLIRTWVENERPDGIYPSHVTPDGPGGGQYTDWITSTAWDVYRVHPNRSFLSDLAPGLARNVDGWEKVYGWGHDPLLTVDSHWWTGMEWQPSFFYFSGYHTQHDTPLRRVDLTAYNFGNAEALSDVFTLLGDRRQAAHFKDLADATRKAVLSRMWDARDGFFYSLNARTDAPARVKEIVGLYPFAFGMVPNDGRYDAAWRTLLDPKQFWTKWPAASASEECAAYSQTGWPVGPGGSGCMWNGPTWPHANSMVMRAMGASIRAGSRAVSREALFDLFHSFTLAQYYDQQFLFPWTGEYYNGVTGAWKTVQRDYNHSTYNDVLISELVGLRPRPDNVLELNPLLPPKAWSYFALDGQSYHGHVVTISWQQPGSKVRYRGKPMGLAVYLDGRLRAHRMSLGPIAFKM